MAHNWKETTFSDLISAAALEIGDGYRAKLSELGSGGPIFLRAAHVKDTHIDFSDTETFHYKLTGSLGSKMSREGDVVVTTKGNSTGRVAFVDRDMPSFVYSPHLSYWRSLDSKKIVPGFLRHWSRSRQFRNQLAGLAASTDMAPYLSLADQRRLCIALPPAEEQKAISEFLSTFDNKMELNRRMNETLEGAARAIFREMFQSAELDSTEVPFGDIAEISRESVNPGAHPAERFEHYSIPGFDGQRQPVRETGAQIKSNKFIVYGDSVLLSKLNPRIPRAWLPEINDSNRSLCSTEFLVLRPRVGYSREFIYGLCSSVAFREIFATMVTGTSGSHQRVKPEYLQKMPIRHPDLKTVAKFTNLVRPLHARGAHNLAENATLTTVRNTLLPKLISGEIRIQQTAKIIEAHA